MTSYESHWGFETEEQIMEPEEQVALLLTCSGVLIKPNTGPITDRIAVLTLLVTEWNQMETETEQGL